MSAAVGFADLSGADVGFMIMSAAMVQLMTPGLALFYGGLVHHRSVIAMMAQNFVSMGIVTVLWAAFMFSLCFGKDWGDFWFVGSPANYPGLRNVGISTADGSTSASIPGLLFALYQCMFAVITPALMTGAFADRLRYGPWLIFLSLWMLFVYCPWCHQIWGGGWLSKPSPEGPGIADFAGGIVVHTTAGFSALAAITVLGERGRPEQERNVMHSVPLVFLGTGLLWFGWFGFNAGSAGASNEVAVAAGWNSQIAAAVSMTVWALLAWIYEGKPGLISLCVGAVAGLATVTPAAGFIQPGAAVTFGIAAAVVCYASVYVLNRTGLDDALDVWGVHGMGGFTGTALLGYFGDGPECHVEPPGGFPLYCVNPGVGPIGSMDQFWRQLAAASCCAVYSFVVTYVLMKIIGFFMVLVPSPEEQAELDLAIHGEEAYNIVPASSVQAMMKQKDTSDLGKYLLDDDVPVVIADTEDPPAARPSAPPAQALVPAEAPKVPSSHLDPVGLKSLPHGSVQAEYVWIGGAHTTGGFDLRSKSRTLDRKPFSPSELPIWNFDGSSTGQAPGENSEVLLKPVTMYPDPFRGGDNIIVLCECLDPAMRPIPTNTRSAATQVFDRALHTEPWFGIEQEYTLFQADGKTPLGWPVGGEPAPQGPYYCSAGYDVSFGRNVMETHYRICLYAGIKISGTNAEVMPGQWEYQVGPCTGIEAGDQLWMSRYLLIRVCEMLEVNVSFDPKPIPGDWNGAGCHTNFSTAAMRAHGGYPEIIRAVEKLGIKHAEHIRVYGEGNDRRLTGRHETASIDRFSYGVADRGASVRIPRTTEAEKRGYFEDRRPASNMDPYKVTAKIFWTSVIE